jgi:hypothetical protein
MQVRNIVVTVRADFPHPAPDNAISASCEHRLACPLTYTFKFRCLLVPVICLYGHKFLSYVVIICQPLAPRSLLASPLLRLTPPSIYPFPSPCGAATCTLDTTLLVGTYGLPKFLNLSLLAR